MGNGDNISSAIKGKELLPVSAGGQREIFGLSLKRAVLAREVEVGKGNESVKPFFGERKRIVTGAYQDAVEALERGAVEDERFAMKVAFKVRILENLDRFSSDREIGYLYELVSFGEDGVKLKRDEVLTRVAQVNALVDEYQFESLTDVFDLPQDQIIEFGQRLGGVVGRPYEEILRDIYGLKNEKIVVAKTRKLISNDVAFSQIVQQAEQGEDVDFDKLEEEHVDLVEEENAQLAALEEVYQGLELYISQTEEAQLEQSAEELSEVLQESDVSPEQFGVITSFVENYLAGGTRFDFKDGHLTFSLTARDGVEIPVHVDGNTLVLKDGEGEIEVPIGQNLRLDREVEVFWVRSLLKKKEEDGEVTIEPEFRDFYYSRDLAKFVSAMSEYKVEIGGQKLERNLEVERIYDYVLNLGVYDLMELQDEIQAAQGNYAALQMLAEKREGEVA